MTGTFPGRIVLVEGDEVDIDLQMGAGKIRLATPFAEIGSWDIDSVEISPQSDGSFELAVAEDGVTFFPNDPSAFEAVVVGTGNDTGTEPDPGAFAFPGQSGSVSPPVGDDWSAPDDSVAVSEDAIDRSGSIEDLSAALEALRAESDEVSDDEPDEGASDEIVDEPSVEAPDLPTDELPEEPSDEPADELPEEPEITVRSFRSSRGRLSAAMAGMRGRSGSEGDDTPDDDTVADDASDVEDAETERRAATGFVIPGDPGYVDPLAAPRAPTFDEDLDDGETIADEIVEGRTALRMTSTTTRSLRFNLRKVGIGLGIAVAIGAIAFATPTVIDILSPDAETGPTAATDTTVAVTSTTVATTTTTLPPTTTVPTSARSEAFDVSSQQFVETWNSVAEEVNPALRFRTLLPTGDFEAGFTQYIAMLGTIGPDATLDRFTIEVDPAGPSDSDQLGIQVLGVAIAVVDPSLEPAERAELLGVLGLDVRNPQLGGLDGQVTRNGVTYALRFDEESIRLLLSVQPAA